MSVVLEALARHAGSRGDSPALSSGASRISYAELDALVSETARTLAEALQDGPGCVAIDLDNGAPWVILDLALIGLGRPTLPAPSFFTAAQMENALADAGADWIICRTEPGARLEVAGETVWLRRLDGVKGRLPAGTAKVTYTSGSTGAAKGVCLSQTQMERVAQSVVARLGAGYAGVHAPILPLGVLLENVAGLYPVLIAGGCYHVEPAAELGCANPFRPDFARMGSTLKRAGATSLILVPELLRGIMAARAFGAMEMPALNFVAVGGAKVAPDLMTMARDIGLPVYEGYGLTECASVVAMNAPGADRLQTVGRPLDHVALDIADDGEIVVRGRTFLGYAGGRSHAGPTATGDVGAIDDDGFLQVTGRKGNLIITSFGRNVSPEWVESELLAEPLIRHALVFGEGRAELRALVAPVFPNVDREQLASSVSRANARLPTYAQIGDFEVLAPLSVEKGELTGNGRMRRQTVLAANAAFVNR